MVHSSQAVQGTRLSTDRPTICGNGDSFPAEPSYQPLFEQILVSAFVASFSLSSSVRVSHGSWTRYLSSWISSSKTLGWSIRATTLLFYAQKSNLHYYKVQTIETCSMYQAGQLSESFLSSPTVSVLIYAFSGQLSEFQQHLYFYNSTQL